MNSTHRINCIVIDDNQDVIDVFCDLLKMSRMDKDSIKCIGKEANNIEFSMIRGVFAEDNNEYANHQKKLRGIIASLTLEKALKIGLDRREFYRLKKKLESGKLITLRRKTIDIVC